MKTTFKIDMTKHVSQKYDDVDLNIRMKSRKFDEIAEATLPMAERFNFVVLDSGYKDTHLETQEIKTLPGTLQPNTKRDRLQLFDLLTGTELKESYTEISSMKIKAKLNINVLRKFNTDKQNIMPISIVRDLLQYSTIELYKKVPEQVVMFRGVISNITIDNLENNNVIFSFDCQGVESSLFNKTLQIPDLSTNIKSIVERRQIFKNKMSKYMSFNNSFDINTFDVPLFSQSDTLWDLLHQFAIFNRTAIKINYNSSSRFGFDVSFAKKDNVKVIVPEEETNKNNFLQQLISNKIADPKVSETKDVIFNKLNENLSSFKRKSKVVLEVKNGEVIVPFDNIYYFKGLNGAIVDWNQSDKNNLTGFTTTSLENGFINAEIGWYTTGNEINTPSVLNGFTKLSQNQQFNMHIAEKTADFDANYMDIIQDLKEQRQKSDSMNLTFKEFVYNDSYNFEVGESYFIKMNSKRSNEKPMSINVEPLVVVEKTTKFNSNSLSEGIQLDVALSSNFTEKWIEIFKATKKRSKWNTLSFDFNIKGDWVYQNKSEEFNNDKGFKNGLDGNLKSGLNNGFTTTSFEKLQPDWTTYKHTRPIIDGQWDNGERIEYDYIEHFTPYEWVGIKSADSHHKNTIIDHYNTQEDDANFSRRYYITPEDFIDVAETDMRGFYANGLTETDMHSFGLVLDKTGFSVVKVLKELVIGIGDMSTRSFQSSRYGFYTKDKAESLKGVNPDEADYKSVEYRPDNDAPSGETAEQKEARLKANQEKYTNLGEIAADRAKTDRLRTNFINIGFVVNEDRKQFEERLLSNSTDAYPSYFASSPIVISHSKKWFTLEDYKKNENNNNGEKWSVDHSKYTWNIKVLNDTPKKHWKIIPHWKMLKTKKHAFEFWENWLPDSKVIGEENKNIINYDSLPKEADFYKKGFKSGEVLSVLGDHYGALIGKYFEQQSSGNWHILVRHSKIAREWIIPGLFSEVFGPIGSTLKPDGSILWSGEGIQLMGMHNFQAMSEEDTAIDPMNLTLMRQTNNKFSKGEDRVSCLATSYRSGYTSNINNDVDDVPVYTLTLAKSQLFDSMKVGNLETPTFKDWLAYIYQNNLTNLIKANKEKIEDVTTDQFGFNGMMTHFSAIQWEPEDLVTMNAFEGNWQMSKQLNVEGGNYYNRTYTYDAKKIRVNTIDGKLTETFKIPYSFCREYSRLHGTDIKFDFNTYIQDNHNEVLKYYFAIETARFVNPQYYINKMAIKDSYDWGDVFSWASSSESDEHYNMIYSVSDLEFNSKASFSSFWKYGLTALSRWFNFLNDNTCTFTNPDKRTTPISLTICPMKKYSGALIDLKFEKFVKLAGYEGSIYGILDLRQESGVYGHFKLLDNNIFKDLISQELSSGQNPKISMDLSLCNTIKLTYDYKNGNKSQTNLVKYITGKQSLSDFSISIDCGVLGIDTFIPGGDITIKKVSFVFYGDEWSIFLPNSQTYNIEDIVDFKFKFSMSPILAHSVPNLNWITAQNVIFGHEITNSNLGLAALGYRNGVKKNSLFSDTKVNLNFDYKTKDLSFESDFSNVNLDSLRDDNIHPNILQGVIVRLNNLQLKKSEVNEAPSLPSNRSNIIDSEIIGKDVWSKRAVKVIKLVSTVFVNE